MDGRRRWASICSLVFRSHSRNSEYDISSEEGVCLGFAVRDLRSGSCVPCCVGSPWWPEWSSWPTLPMECKPSICWREPEFCKTGTAVADLRRLPCCCSCSEPESSPPCISTGTPTAAGAAADPWWGGVVAGDLPRTSENMRVRNERADEPEPELDAEAGFPPPELEVREASCCWSPLPRAPLMV